MIKNVLLALVLAASPCIAQVGPVSGGVERFNFQDGNGFHGTVTSPTNRPTLSLTFDFAQPKAAVVAATVGSNITLAGTQLLDGHAVSSGDRVLVKDQTNAAQNGIYVVVDPGAWTRATDDDTGSEMLNASCFVSLGTVNSGSTWQCNTLAPIVIGTTPISFVQTSASSSTFARGAGTLSVSSVNNYSIAQHTHAITSSSDPGMTASLLSTNVGGALKLFRLGIGIVPTQALDVLGNILIEGPVANLFMGDTSTGFQVAASTVVTPQAGDVIRNTSFASGVRGWNISDNGDAEFNNMLIRGELRASVFRINEITATAGTFGVFYSASTLFSDTTTPAIGNSFSFNAKNSDAGGSLFAVNDIVRFKTWTGGGIGDSWALITAFTPSGNFTNYTATLESGSTGVTFSAGSAIVDYGPSGTGFITESADGTIGATPNLTMATHSGSPWSSQTLLTRLGNLNGSYGYGSNVYGLGIGSYGIAGQSWQTYDTTNGIRIGNNVSTIGQWDVNGKLVLGQVAASSPNIAIDATDGFRVRNNTTNLITLDTSGNATFGQEITSSGNVHWNSSNDRLEFRGGVNGRSVQSFIDTDGSFVFSNCRLNANGLNFTAGTVVDPTNAVNFVNAGSITGTLQGAYRIGDASTIETASLLKGGDSSGTASTTISAYNDAAHLAFMAVVSEGTAAAQPDKTYGYVWGSPGGTFAGFNIGSNAFPTHTLEVHGDALFTSPIKIATGTPASSGAAGATGQIEWDANFVYICVAPNTWKRAAIATW